MQYAVVCAVALLASILTFFSGFGLGTILTPAFVLFFPVDAAIAMTAVVHLANNLLKVVLVGGAARRDIVLRFGIPAILAALVGAWMLTRLAKLPPLGSYELAGRVFLIEPVKLILAVIMLYFAAWESIPATKEIALPSRWLSLGGLLSGFFGGLSGNQGAFRSMFLLRAGLSKEAFIATGVVIAVLIDLTRLPVYFGHLRRLNWRDVGPLILAAILAAGLGTILGKRLLPTITFATVRWVVAAMLMLIAIGLGSGLI